nr:protein odr 4 [Hymenolepis microstoma]
MLPAGPRVSGFYYCGPLNLSKSGSRVKEILHALHQIEKNPIVNKYVPLMVRDKVFLHVDPVTKTFTAKAIDFDQPKDFLRPVDVKVRSVMDRWRAIKTHINLTIDTYLPAERQKETIFAELHEAVSPFLETITSNTRILLNGDLKEDSDPVFSKKIVGKPARHSKRHRHLREIEPSSTDDLSSSPWDSTNFILFSSDFPSWRRTNSSSSVDSGHASDAFTTPVETISPRPEGYKNLTIHGRIPGLAFLPIDGTNVGDALRAFRKDLVQSIIQRLELLTEELQISGGEVDCARILLPSRVLVRIPACPACPLSDYKFVSETPDDVIRRVALFCRPLGSATPPALLRTSTPSGYNSSLSTPADSGECSSDSEFNADEDCVDKEVEEVVVKMANDGDNMEDMEPVFDAACLDTQLERTFDSDSAEEEISQLELLTDIQEIAQTVKQSRGKILLFGSAFAVLILSTLTAIYMDLLSL